MMIAYVYLDISIVLGLVVLVASIPTSWLDRAQASLARQIEESIKKNGRKEHYRGHKS